MFKVEPGTYKIVHVDFNENTNGLLRQYFPKGMDLSNIHQNRLNAVARRLNERPRETLQFRTPAEKFSECVASTS
jgi:IS30 family transposase